MLDYPGVSLLQGRFDKSSDLMLGRNTHESDVFTATDVDSRDKIATKLRTSIYGITDSTVDYILTELYPSPSETELYLTEYAGAALLLSEYTFVCNTRYVATALGNDTWNYRFQVPPGNHALDLEYKFYSDYNARDIVSELAVQMQLYFTQFAANGNPNRPALPSKWPRYGGRATVATFGSEGVSTAKDDASNERCVYWQRGTYTT